MQIRSEASTQRHAFATAPPMPSADGCWQCLLFGTLCVMEIKLILFRLLTLVALAACCASLLDHILPSPAFCGFQAGCDAVTQSSFGSLLGVPLPVWGLLAFGAFYALTLFPNHPLARLISLAAVVAGLSGLALILLQVFVIRQLCPLCLITDAAAVLILAVEIGFVPPNSGAVPVARPRRWLWVGGAVFAIAGPLVWPILRPTLRYRNRFKLTGPPTASRS